MAKGRRPPPALRGTLGTLLRTTLQQVGVVRDVVERQARSSRSRLDSALLQRKHRDTLLSLGEAVYNLAVSGELGDLEEFPEIMECLAELESLEAQIAGSLERAQREAAGMPTRPRGRANAAPVHQTSSRDNSFRVWRPSLPEDPLDDDPVDLGEPVAATRTPVPERKPQRSAARSRRARRAARSGSGGIAFVADDPLSEDDADLKAYMHEDDVPADDR